jgi:hypothetical protein
MINFEGVCHSESPFGRLPRTNVRNLIAAKDPRIRSLRPTAVRDDKVEMSRVQEFEELSIVGSWIS